MTLYVRLLAAVLLCLVHHVQTEIRAADGGQAGHAFVGRFGDLSKATVVGNEHFTAKAITDSLQHDYVISRYSRSLASLAELLPIVDKRVTAGYLAAGFPKVDVTCSIPAQAAGVRITVIEGQRYLLDTVKVTKPGPFTEAYVLELLTEPMAKHPEFFTGLNSNTNKEQGRRRLLPIGDPANFSVSASQRVEELLLRACREHGFLIADIDLQWSLDEAGKASATVSITTGDEPQALAAIEIDGNTLHSDEEVLAWLRTHCDLAIGERISPQLLSRARRALVRSCSFLTPSLLLDPDTPTLTLRIDAHDHDKLPRLDQQDWRRDAALAIHDWLEREVITGSTGVLIDLDAKAQGTHFTSLLQAGRGLEMDLHWLPMGLDQAWHARLRADERGLAWNYGGNELHLSLLEEGQVVLNVSMGTQIPDEEDQIGYFTFNIGMTTSRDELQPGPLAMNLQSSPTGILSMFGNDRWEREEANGLTTIRKADEPAMFVRYETATGRPRAVQVATESGILVIRPEAGGDLGRPAPPVDSEPATTEFVTDLFAQMGQDVMVLWDQLLVLFPIIEAETRKTDEVRAILSLSLALMRQFEQRVRALPDDDPADTFSLPSDPDFAFAIQDMAGVIAGFIATMTAEYCSRETWPVLLTQEAHALMTGANADLGLSLQAILANDYCGPIGYWATASLLELANLPQAAPVAQAGLQRCNARWLWTDIRVLLHQAPGLAEIIAGLDLTDEHLSLAPVEHRQRLQDLVAMCKQAKMPEDQDRAGRLIAAFLWEIGLGEAIVEALTGIIERRRPQNK